jgi:hypothetical protein
MIGAVDPTIHSIPAWPALESNLGFSMSKRNKTDKERIDSVYGVVNVGSDSKLSMQYDFATDRLEILGALPGYTKTERRYERSSGKAKVVTSVPSDGPSAFDAKRALYAYDWAFAVDTNSTDLHGSRCAACFSHYVQLPPRGFTGSLVWRPLRAFLISGLAAGINPERIRVVSHRVFPGPAPASPRTSCIGGR